MKNTIDVNVFEDMTLPLTNSNTTSLESPKKEGTSEDKEKARHKLEERGEENVAEVSLTAQNTDDKVTNGLKPRLWDTKSMKDKGTKVICNKTPTFNVDLQCSTEKENSTPGAQEQDSLSYSFLNLGIKAEAVSCPSSSTSIWKLGKHPEVSINKRNLKENKTELEEELKIPQMEKCNDDAMAHIPSNVDIGISSQLRSPLLLNAWGLEAEDEEKKQVVESTLTAPSRQSGPFTKRKGIPTPPEPESKQSFTAFKKENTDVNVSLNNDQPSDDDVIMSSKDLLSISWQIAQGMVSVSNYEKK